MNLGQYIANLILEDESKHQQLLKDEKEEIERAAKDLNIFSSDIEQAFTSGKITTLTTDIWSKLENSDSWNIKSLEDATKLAKKYKKNWKPTLSAIEADKTIALPLILKYGKNKYYLVGGNTRLMFYKALKKSPEVLIGTLDSKVSLKENLLQQQRLNESQTATIGEFIKYACKNLGIQKPPSNLTLSYDTEAAKEKRSFGYFDPNTNKIWIYVRNRNMADILRTLAHELVHRKQDEDGRISYESGETGSDIENEANAQAGVLLRDYGKIDNSIYEAKKYGDYLFGDKASGVKIKWYGEEKEPDTPSERALFDFLEGYADSESDAYSTINLDPYYDVFKKIKQEYPEIGETRLMDNQYIYRGTLVSKEKIESMFQQMNMKYDPSKTTTIPDQTYSSSRKISSWGVHYMSGFWFAINQMLNKNPSDKVPVVMRAKAGDAELFFNPEFMNKLSNTAEYEVLNATNPMPVDVMVLSDLDWKKLPASQEMELIYK